MFIIYYLYAVNLCSLRIPLGLTAYWQSWSQLILSGQAKGLDWITICVIASQHTTDMLSMLMLWNLGTCRKI